jgi:hypothetical protein
MKTLLKKVLDENASEKVLDENASEKVLIFVKYRSAGSKTKVRFSHLLFLFLSLPQTIALNFWISF